MTTEIEIEVSPMCDCGHHRDDHNQQVTVKDVVYEKSCDKCTCLKFLSEDLAQALKESKRDEVITKAKKVLEPVELTPELTRELSFDELGGILETTIKRDYEAKVITFIAMLSAQTDSDMINIGFQSDSSTGKTYTATECAKYFPEGEVMKLFNVSKTAFFYDRGIYDKETGIKTIDLEGKILIFLDQPHYTLLETLRPLLSHDDKVVYSKITNKDKSGTNRTQNIAIRGFFTVIYCSANKRTDEQEQTRLLFLSAASDDEKLRESIGLSFIREADKQAYEQSVNEDPQRRWLKQRVLAIRQTGIRNIVVPQTQTIKDSFMQDHPHLLPRHQRDVQRIFDFVKASALLNCFNRKKVDGKTIEATEDDIRQGYALYKRIEQSNELGLSPAVFEFWQKVVIPTLQDSDTGVSRKDIARRYLQVYHKTTSKEALGRLLEELENRGLVSQEPDPEDKRKILIFSGISSATCGDGTKQEEISSAVSGGTSEDRPELNGTTNLDTDHTPSSCTTNLENQPLGGGEWLRCPTCGELCHYKSGLDWHLKQHPTGDGPKEVSQ